MDSLSVPLFLVDSFADLPFTGNPAAVCVLEAPRSGASDCNKSI